MAKSMTWLCCGGIELETDERCTVCGDRYEDLPIFQMSKKEELKNKSTKCTQPELFDACHV